jgi:DNA-binding NarL/FixJ family response regulator
MSENRENTMPIKRSWTGYIRSEWYADDSLIVRAGLTRLLEAAGLTVVAEAADVDELIRAVALSKPDIAIVDIRMPPTHTDEGIRAAQRSR